MCSCCRAAFFFLAGAALLSAGAARGQVLGRVGDVVPRGRPVFPRPTGATFGPGATRPRGASFVFTFGPLLREPFRPGDRFPRNEARHAGEERTDLTPDEAPIRFDLLPDAPERFQPFRADLPIDAPLSDRLDLLPHVPADAQR